MRLFVRHVSEYRFAQPQARLVQLLRVTPGNHHGQSVVSWNIEVDRDARLKAHRDGYGNDTTMLYLDGPFTCIRLEVAGEVLTEDRAGVVAGAAEPLPPACFLQPTVLTHADAAVIDLAQATAASSPLARAHALADAVGERLAALDPDPANDPHAAAALAAGRADPQGAAHLLIAAARAAALPARYVAGHVYRPDAEESHAAHGWAELHVDGYGWIGFDPLAGCCPTDHYVRVAVGLDHGQAAPVSGARIGSGGEWLGVDVHVGPTPFRATRPDVRDQASSSTSQ